MRRRQVLLDQILERARAVAERLGYVRVHLAGAVPPAQALRMFEKSGSPRNSRINLGHDSDTIMDHTCSD